MTQVVFSGSTGTISNLNQNFTQLYSLRELISDPAYTAAVARIAIAAAGNITINAPSSGAALILNGLTAASVTAGAAQIQNDRIVTFLDSAAGTTNCGFIWFNSSNTLLLGAGNASRFTISVNGNVAINQPVSGTALSVSGGIVETGAGGVGYATGSGGTVTQATSKSTGVTLNKTNGTITMNAASLAATTSVSFVLTNSTIAATDVVNVAIKSGATLASYFTQVDATAAGSCTITLRNYTGGSLAEAVVLSFAVLKAVAA